MESVNDDFHSFIFCRRENVFTIALHFNLGLPRRAGLQIHRLLVAQLEGGPSGPAGLVVDSPLVPDVMAADIVKPIDAVRIMRSLPRDQCTHHIWEVDRGGEQRAAMRAVYMQIMESLDEDDESVGSPLSHSATQVRGASSDGEEYDSSDYGNDEMASVGYDNVRASTSSLTLGTPFIRPAQTTSIWHYPGKENVIEDGAARRDKKRKASDTNEESTKSNKKPHTETSPSSLAKWMRF